MTKKITALAALVILLLTQRPHAATTARIFFVDVGTGASTLIVSPEGHTLLVDGGPPGSGAKIIALLDSLGIAQIENTIITHYHIDHMGGMIEVMNAGRVAGTAYDNGDGAGVQPPGTSTSSSSTRGTYLNYVTATGHAGITRQTAIPGSFIDFGDGMRATFVAAGGHFLSGGSVQITNADLNSESISTLVEYKDFDYLVSGDMTGGGSTSTAKTPDVETYVAQMVGDVDVVQLDHHGSTTANNQTFLAALKAEVAFAQTGDNNGFGHPNRETANKFLNTPDTAGAFFAGTGVPPTNPSPALSAGPVFYQSEAPQAGDDRVTLQGYTGATAGNAGQGTVLLSTDGLSTYTMSTFDPGGSGFSHTYNVDGVSSGITTDFKPTVVVRTAPVLPLASDDVTVTAAVDDRESAISAVSLAYSINGAPQAPIAMTPPATGDIYTATIPHQLEGARVDYSVTATTASGQQTTFGLGYFSGVTPIVALRAQTAKGEPLYNGYAARIRGTVTASGFSSGTNDDYVQDLTGAINVYRSTDTPTAYTSTTPGQTVEVFGRIGFNGGRLRLDITESVENTTSPYGIQALGTDPHLAPAVVTIAGLSTNPESFEGQFVTVTNAHIVSGTFPTTTQSLDQFVTISDGTGTFSMKIDHDTDVDGYTGLGATFDVTGIVQQDDYLRPFDSGYSVTPRSRVDLGAPADAPPTLLTIAEARVDAISNADGTPGADLIPDRLNQTVLVQGTVSSIDFRGGNGVEYYIQDGTGGIDLFNTGTNFGPFQIGDIVQALGTVTHFNGLTELTITSMSLVSSGGPAPSPVLITLAQLANGGGEAFEGQLVRIDNVAITDGSLYPALNASGNLSIADGTASGTLRIDSDTDIDGTSTPAAGTTLSITGILGQFASAPFDSGYQVLPRMLTDIVITGGAGPALTASPATIAFASTNVGSALISPVTITNNGTSPLTLTTPFTITGTDASQFTVGVPAATTLAGGASTTASVTFVPTTAGAKSATLNIASSNGSTTVTLTGTATTPGGGGGTSPILISEFRVHGSAGGNDEFVEIYNNSDNPVDISGYVLRGSNNAGTNSVRATVAPSTVLPGRTHYLFVNTGSNGYSAAVPGNMTYTTGITDDGGLAIATSSSTPPVITDAVGLSTGSVYKEGAILTPLTTNTNRSYERKPGGAAVTLQDTNDNASDFQLLTPAAGQNATPQNIVLTALPTAVNFGSAAPGDIRTQTITIRNLLSSQLTLNTPTITGTDAAAFAAGTPSTLTLAAGTTTSTGGTATITVTFQPADTGAKSASLVVTSSSSGTVTIPLTGTGTGGLNISPSTVDFGTVQPGSTALSTLTLTNTNATSVTLTPPFAISGANAADFIAGAPGVTTIPGGGSTSLSLAFAPAAPGPKSATLTITSNGAPRTIPLTGMGSCPAITVGGSLSNGTVGALYAGTVSASGDPGPFSYSVSIGSLPAGLVLSAGGVISGTPTTVGTFPFTVQATTGTGCTGSAPFSVSIAPAPVVLTAAPSTVAFGIVPASTTSTQTVTFTNVGASPIVLSAPSISGPDAARFTVGALGAASLNPGASTTAAVSFTPTAGGVRTATLSVSPSGGAIATVSLTGTGSIATPVVISEFRFRGPGGATDEFVEIYNNTDAPIDISGWKLMGSSQTAPTGTRATVPSGVMLPGRSHYLFTSTSYAGTVPGNATYGTGISDNGGVALTLADGTIVDQVGVQTTGGYREGTALATQLTTSVDRGYERVPGGNALILQDTDDNATDFQVTTPSHPQNTALVVSPASLDFGSVVQTTKHTLGVTIKNLLATAVTLDTVSITGSDAGDFTAGAPGASSLAPNTSTTVNVSFQPPATGSKTASLTITSAIGGTLTISLAGISTADVTPPTLTLPADITVEGTGPATPVSFTATATDAVDPSPTVSCTPASGSGFPLGTTTVTCTATDAHNNSANGTFAVTITDTTAPALTLPGNITAEAAGAATPISFTATAIDAVDPAPGVVCSPSSGTAFPLGTTAVTCTATDASHNHVSAGFTVTISDTTAPTITVPANIAAEATGATTAVTYTATASDLVDGSIAATCMPASGTGFPVGTTPVSCTATDAHNNTGSASFAVTITDHTGPVVTVPANITTEATGPTTAVSFTASASDLVDGARPVTCSPASGSAFTLGTTSVTCSAADTHGNTNSSSFTVAVRDTTAPVISSVSASPASLWPPNHALVPVTITATAVDAVNGAAGCAITSVSSSEPIDGLGDGDTAPDWTTPAGLTVSLRAERSGNGPGRTYTLGIRCTDASGNASTATQLVVVPHDKGK